MINTEMAKDYMHRAERCLKEARLALDEKDPPSAIRRSQEALELITKAYLRLIGIEYPKTYDISDILLNHNRTIHHILPSGTILPSIPVPASHNKTMGQNNTHNQKHKYILYNTYAFPSNLLSQPPLQKEIQKLYQWITNTSPTHKQFTKHTIQYLNLQTQYHTQKYNTPRKQQLPNTTTQLKTEAEIHYHTIKQTAKHLKTLLNTTKQHKTNIITQLLED